MASKEQDSRAQVRKINRQQKELFDRLYHLFDPPLPEGVPRRLEQIVAAGRVRAGDTVLDVGSGTGILIPLIRSYHPARIYACDLSPAMLAQLSRHHPRVRTLLSDVRDLTLPDASLDVVFINACYPNIVDKTGAFTNIARMMKPAGRLVISHPMGRAFIERLKKSVPFPLDDFPTQSKARRMLANFGFEIETFVDQEELYILTALKNAGTGPSGSGKPQPHQRSNSV